MIITYIILNIYTLHIIVKASKILAAKMFGSCRISKRIAKKNYFYMVLVKRTCRNAIF